MEAQQISVVSNSVVIQQNHRKLARIELTIRELTYVADELDRQIAVEEGKSGIRDPKHFAYPTFAKAAAHRRDNLLRTIEDLNRWALQQQSAA
jgi:hypothetical protein